MQIQTPCVATLRWRLMDAQGNPIDERSEPVAFLIGGDDLLPVIEERLQGCSSGDVIELHLEPEQAFGDYDATLVGFEPRALFPADIAAGMTLDRLPPGTTTADLPPEGWYTVSEVYPEHVVIDGNHPLAGMGLNVDLTVVSVREATAEEIEQRSAGSGWLSVVSDARPAARRALH